MSIFYTDVSHRGGKIYLRYIDGNTGARRQRVIEFKPELYIRSNDNKTCDAKSMWDEPLSRIEFESTREMNGFMEQYKDVDGFNIYGMRDPIFQFITKMFKGKIEYDQKHIRRNFVDIEVFSGDIDADGRIVQGPFPKPETADYPISAITMYTTHDGIYHVWGLEVFKGKFVGTYKHNPEHSKIGKLKIDYRGFDNERSLLEDFVSFWSDVQADLWTGYNVQGFDNPYLTNRIEKVCGTSTKKNLSPWGIVNTKTTPNNFGGEDTYYQFFGMAMVDYQDLFKKHAFKNPDNYRLETVAQLILKEGKIDYSESPNLNTLYLDNFQKYIEYNIFDVTLVVRLDQKQQFVDLTFTLAYLTKSNYEDTLATIRPWSALAYSMLHERGEEPLLRPVYQGDIKFAGGFVKEPKPDIYQWVVSVDLNSLYPHLIQQYNLGIETIVEPKDLPDELKNMPHFTLDDLVNKRVDLSILKKYDLAMTANRQFFRKDRMAIFSEKTRDIYSSRKVVKKEMLGHEQKQVDLEASEVKTADIIAMLNELDMLITSMNNLQQALKILMNGLYGALANRYLKEFFDLRIAEGVTLSGQLSIIWIARKLDEYFNNILKLGSVDYKVICNSNPPETILQTTGNGHRWVHYVDTDSNYLNLKPLIDKFFTEEQQKNEQEKIINFIDKLFKEKIEPYIDKCFEELAYYMNAYEQRMFMKREVIAPIGVWVAKKRYALMVADSEGVRMWPNMELKITGLDAKKAEFPKFCREWMEDCYEISMMQGEKELQERVKKAKKDFMALPVEQIAAPKGVNGLEKYSDPNTIYTKGTPKHVKAALNHNYLVKKLGLNILPIQSGEKLLFVELKKPNPYNMEVIAFQKELPEEFGLHKYVDYESNYNKNFIEPLKNFIDTLNFSPEIRPSVLDWF